MMNLTDKVKEAVYQQTTFLSGLVEPDLEELLNQSRWNRRVRNVTPLYGLLYQQDKWKSLLKQNREISSLQTQFKKALVHLEHTDPKTSLVAKELKSQLFPGGKTYVLVNRRDTSEEMAKLLQSLVRNVELEENLNPTTKNSVNERLERVDFNNLFLKNNYYN